VFQGVEQRLELVEVAKASASGIRYPPIFEHGNMVDVDWPSYDGFYLFNPFFELTAGPWCQIDDSLPFSREKQKAYIDAVAARLLAAKSGTRVATYFGFGGVMPDGFVKTAYDHHDLGPLEFWCKE